MADRTCAKCGHIFRDPSSLRRHQIRKKSCVDIVETGDLTEDERLKEHACRFCGRRFTLKTNLTRHVQNTCKIATSDEGMEKLLEHTLRQQMAEQNSKIDRLAALLETSLVIPAGHAATATAAAAQNTVTIVNGPVTQTSQQIHIEKIEIHPWDDQQVIAVGVREVLAAFTENARLREYTRLPEYQLSDLEIAPPYVAELLIDLMRRAHENPATRNVYLNPKRADQVLVHLKSGRWEVRAFASASQALLDGVATSIHQITLTYEKRKQLPLEAQNALAVAGLLYDDERETYVERTKGPLVAHLTNLAPMLMSSVAAEKR